MKLISFHNDPKVKDKYVKRLEKHHELDQIIQGKTWGPDTQQGCAVGCCLEKYDHKAYETELGLPEWLARLEDTIFEGLPAKDAPKFAVDFLTSIPVGVNLDRVKWQFCSFILKENIDRVLKLKIKDDLKKQVVESIQGVLSLTDKAIETGVWDESAARSAESAAWSAASAASAARSAARSAAWSAAWSAESAAWSAASAARSAAYKKYASHLIELLKNSDAQEK